MMTLSNIHKTYQSGQNNKVYALAGIDLSIAAGEFVVIMGPSGSGKSTLLNILGLLDSCDEGTYQLASVSVHNLSERQAAMYRNRLLGFVFQSFHLLPFKTALENVALPLSYQNVRRPHRRHRALTSLQQLGLADQAHRFPHQLSSGQRQRVAIARALVTNPKVILADEPTGNLDSRAADEVMDILQQIHASGRTIVMVTHEERLAVQAERLIRMQDGSIV